MEAERRILSALSDARRHLASGSLEKAESALSGVDETHPDVIAMGREIERVRETLREQEAERQRQADDRAQRARQVDEHRGAALSHLQAGDLAGALRLAKAALAIAPGDTRSLSVLEEIQQAFEEERARAHARTGPEESQQEPLSTPTPIPMPPAPPPPRPAPRSRRAIAIAGLAAVALTAAIAAWLIPGGDGPSTTTSSPNTAVVLQDAEKALGAQDLERALSLIRAEWERSPRDAGVSAFVDRLWRTAEARMKAEEAMALGAGVEGGDEFKRATRRAAEAGRFAASGALPEATAGALEAAREFEGAVRAAPWLQQAEGLFAGRRIGEALALVLKHPDDEGRADVGDLVRRMHGTALQNAQTSLRNASQAGVATEVVQPFRNEVATSAKDRSTAGVQVLLGMPERVSRAGVDDLKVQVEDLVRSNDLTKAAVLLARGRAVFAGARPLEHLADDVARRAEQRAAQAREAALSAKADSRPKFKDGAMAQQTARASENLVDSVARWLQAERLFNEAAKEGPLVIATAPIPTPIQIAVEDATTLVNQGKDREALEVLDRRGVRDSQNQGVESLLVDMQGRALSSAASESASANARGAAGSDLYQRGSTQMLDAQRAADGGNRPQAIRSYWDAADNFRRAVKPSGPPPPPPVDDRAAIEALMRRIEAAYASLNVDQVRKVLPNMPFADLTNLNRNMKNYESYSLSIHSCALVPQAGGMIARCQERRVVRPKSGRTIDDTRGKTYYLSKEGSAWKVDRYEYQ
jgi:tetratricopeptide (TPR) repeat protein